jgi:hypothetical protein
MWRVFNDTWLWSPSQSGPSQKFQHVAVGVFEINAAPAVPGIDLHVILREWTAAVGDSGLLNAIEDRVELRIAAMTTRWMP